MQSASYHDAAVTSGLTGRLFVSHACLGAACKPSDTSNFRLKAHQAQHLLAPMPVHTLCSWQLPGFVSPWLLSTPQTNSVQPVQEQRRKNEAQALRGRHLGGTTAPKGDSFLHSPHRVGAHVSLRSKLRPQQPSDELPVEMPVAARHRALLQSGEKLPVRAGTRLRTAACGIRVCCCQLDSQVRSGERPRAQLGSWLTAAGCVCVCRAVHLHCTALMLLRWA